MAEEVTLNQLGTMIEGLRGDVKAVAEGHGVIRSEMKQMKTELLEKIEEIVKTMAKHANEMKDKPVSPLSGGYNRPIGSMGSPQGY